MISKAKIKYIRSLEHKKNRNQANFFVAEGPKVVGDLLATFSPKLLVHTEIWKSPHSLSSDVEEYVVSDEELRKISFLQHPQEVLAIFEQLINNEPLVSPSGQLVLAIDGVQDPGNMGTIIRIADWFGINNIICSRDTVDVYNPKVIQATMGSIAHVAVTYLDLVDYLGSLPQQIPVYGTLLDGDDIYEKQLTDYGIIVMGNEGKGISPEVRGLITNKLLIPNYPRGRETTDSLNVAIATAITCNEFRRRK